MPKCCLYQPHFNEHTDTAFPGSHAVSLNALKRVASKGCSRNQLHPLKKGSVADTCTHTMIFAFNMHYI